MVKITPPSQYDLIIIGAGLIGLSTARAILKREPSLKLAIVEKEETIAMHQSGRNSGVIHSGIYYKPGSLKANMCVAGAEAMYAYCKEKQIPTQQCGKVIIAVKDNELQRLENLYKRGQENGVPHIQWLDAQELKKKEPYAAGLAAVYCPTTGIVDYTEVARALAEEIQEMGAEIITSFEVDAISSDEEDVILISTKKDILCAHYLISCGGVYADRLASQNKGSKTPQIIPFRGDYLILKPHARHIINGLIYPVPDPQFPFLGVHFTPRMDGSVWLGPNAVLAFSREGYRLGDMNINDLLEVFKYPGFRKLITKHWKMGCGEFYRDLFKFAYVRALQQYIPMLRAFDCFKGPSGIRAQALNPDGTLVDDFVFDSPMPRTLHVRNAPSPGATSCLVIGEAIAQKVEEGMLERV